MKLDDFLKCKKVRLLTDGYTNLNKGSEYNLVRLEVVISNNAGIKGRYPLDSFEPVLDSAENPLQGAELTPEFGAVEPILVDNCEVNTQDNSVNTQDNSVNIQDTPKFRVGDPVYCPLQTKELCKVFSNDQEFQPQCPLTITKVRSRHSGVSGAVVACVDDYGYSDEYDNAPFIFHATPENHALLSKLHPHIKFEAPPKPLTGSDLARAMLDKGWKYVPCYISDSSDTHALERQTRTIVAITGMHKDHPSFFIYGSGKSFIPYAVPFDPKTSEPLTESVLDE